MTLTMAPKLGTAKDLIYTKIVYIRSLVQLAVPLFT